MVLEGAGWEGAAQKCRSRGGLGAGDPALVTPSWTLCVIIILLISFLNMAFEEKRSLWMDGKGDTREKTAASVLREQWGEPQINTDWLGDTCVPSGINPCFLL